MNIPNIIMSLSQVRYPLDITERVPSFTGISTHVRILSRIKVSRCVQEYFKDDAVSNDRGVEWETDIGWV